MRTKRVVAIILAMAIILNLAACGGNNVGQEPEGTRRKRTTESATESAVIGDSPAGEKRETSKYTTGNEIVTDKPLIVSNNPYFHFESPKLELSVFQYDGLYTGEWKDGKPNGYGEFTASVRLVPGTNRSAGYAEPEPDYTDDWRLFDYEGFWVNGEITGEGRAVTYEYTCECGDYIMMGSCTPECETNSIFCAMEGNFKNGIMNGVGKVEFYPHDDYIHTIYVAEFVDGKPVGEGIIASKAQEAVGMFGIGSAEYSLMASWYPELNYYHIAEGIIIYSDGSVYEGIIGADSDSKRQGRLTFGEGNFYIEGNWKNTPKQSDIDYALGLENERRATYFTKMMHQMYPVKIQWASGYVYDGYGMKGVFKAPDGTETKVLVGENYELVVDNSEYNQMLTDLLIIGGAIGLAVIFFSAVDGANSGSGFWYHASGSGVSDAIKREMDINAEYRRSLCWDCNRVKASDCICKKMDRYGNCPICERSAYYCKCNHR